MGILIELPFSPERAEIIKRQNAQRGPVFSYPGLGWRQAENPHRTVLVERLATHPDRPTLTVYKPQRLSLGESHINYLRRLMVENAEVVVLAGVVGLASMIASAPTVQHALETFSKFYSEPSNK